MSTDKTLHMKYLLSLADIILMWDNTVYAEIILSMYPANERPR